MHSLNHVTGCFFLALFSADHDHSASLAQEVNGKMYFRVLVLVIVRILEEAHSFCCYCTFRRLDCDAELFFPGAL